MEKGVNNYRNINGILYGMQNIDGFLPLHIQYTSTSISKNKPTSLNGQH